MDMSSRDRQQDRLVGGRLRLRAGIALAASLLVCVLPATAGATIVTVGTPTASLGTPTGQDSCTCTKYQLTASGSSAPDWQGLPAGQNEAVPADGVIVDWRVTGSGNLTLEALRPSTGLAVVGQSTGQTGSAGFGTRAAHIPVLAGDLIGVHLVGNNAQVATTGGTSPGSTIGEIRDSPSPFPPLISGGMLFLNADVALTPVVASVTPASGPTGGTNLVTINGQFFDGATGVQFGGLAAAFTVISPTQITAYAPLEGPGPVDVTVTGPAATSAITPADLFTFLPKPTGPSQTSFGSATPISPILGSGGFVLSPLALSRSYFLADPSSTSRGKTTTGSKVSYTVSAAATTTFVIQQARSGRLLPAAPGSPGVRECVAPSRTTLLELLPACVRYVSLAPALTHTSPAGLAAMHVSGRLGRHALTPGSYRLLATAASTATPGLVSPSVTHAFHILAPPAPPRPGAKPKAHAALPSKGSGAAKAPTG